MPAPLMAMWEQKWTWTWQLWMRPMKLIRELFMVVACHSKGPFPPLTCAPLHAIFDSSLRLLHKG